MRNTSLLLIGLMLLGGCTAAPSSEPVDETTFDNTSLWGLIETWSPDVSWSAPVAGTNTDTIIIDDAHSIPAGMIQTTFITSTVTAEEYEETFASGTSRNALDAMMELSGGQPHMYLDADGAMGTQWGYALQSNAGLEFMIISAVGKDCAASEDVPPSCSTYTATATHTAALVEGDDL